MSTFPMTCILFDKKICKSRYATTQKPPQGGFDVEMMGFLGMGNNPMVGATVSVAVAVEEALKG